MEKTNEEIMIQAEKDSFKEAAFKAKEHKTYLIFAKDGNPIRHYPSQKDLDGKDIKPIELND